MRLFIMIVCALLILIPVGCGNQDKAEKSIAVPKVDLHTAVVTNDFDVIRQHIKAGSDINVMEPTRESSPLITAAYLGHTEAAKILIEGGADLNYTNVDGSTALHTACVFGRTETAILLIDSGAELNGKNKGGSTPLHSAAFFCHGAIVKALLDKGADKTITNSDGKTALQVAEIPFEAIVGFYDAIGTALKPLGIQLDYERIKATRPKIAAMLRE